MPTEKKSIETLVAEARLKDAQSRFREFLDFCDDEKDFLLQSVSRISFLENTANLGTMTREGEIERNQITLSFIKEISEFRSKLSDYFGVGDSKQLFDNIKSRDEIVLKALEPRITDRQYILENQLKDGNSSIIFQLAKAHTGQKAIALVLKTPEISPTTKGDFIRLTEIRHRNILKLLDHSLDSFPFFIITEYVHGENLTKAINKTGVRPLAQLVDWMYQLADALDYMRHKGIMHTNVRPSKIYVDEEFNAMISPFDFNQTNKEERTFSRFKDVCLYGSPELLACDGEPLSLSDMCISDQYSLGLIAYKVITGKELFEGNSVIEILKSRHKFSADEHYRAKKLSAFPKNALGKIFIKLLHESPKKRYANLREVVRVFHTYTHNTEATRSSNGVRNSYRRCLAKNRMLISDFYDLLFKKLPAVKADFQDGKRQIAIMQMAVDLLIDIDEKQSLLTALMQDKKHQSYALSHFDVFIDTLLETIKNNDVHWAQIEPEWMILREKTIKIIQEARNNTA
jgi:serine/threonine protein kinase